MFTANDIALSRSSVLLNRHSSVRNQVIRFQLHQCRCVHGAAIGQTCGLCADDTFKTVPDQTRIPEMFIPLLPEMVEVMNDLLAQHRGKNEAIAPAHASKNAGQLETANSPETR